VSGNFPENPASEKSGNFFALPDFFRKSRRKNRKFFPDLFGNFFSKKPDRSFRKFFLKTG
jgi:hypothetical protein